MMGVGGGVSIQMLGLLDLVMMEVTSSSSFTKKPDSRNAFSTGGPSIRPGDWGWNLEQLGLGWQRKRILILPAFS